MINQNEQINKLAVYRCETILEATEDNESFDGSYIEKMLDSLQRGYKLSSNQYAAIENIYESWGS